MKIKSLYIYGIAILAIVAVLVITSTSKNSVENEIGLDQNSTMPQDDIHKGLTNNQNAGPSKDNVKADFWEKLDVYKKKTEADPKDTLKLRKYAELLSLAHQSENALEQYEKILKVDPNRVDILLSEGLIYFGEGNYSKAEIVTNRIIEINENHLEAKFNLGVIAASKGETEKARVIWTELVKNNSGTEAAKYAAEALTKL